MNRATPITSALKRKYSPFKETEAKKEAKKLLVDESGKSVYAQTSIKTPGKTETKKRLSYKEAWDQDVDGIRTSGMYKDYGSYVDDREGQRKKDPVAFEEGMAAATGVSGGPGTVTITTPGSEEKSEVKLKTKVEGTSMTPENLRRQIRKGKIAANQEKRATAQAARTQAKLDKLKKAGDTSSAKYKRLEAKLKQKNQIASLAGEAGKNVMRQTEEGKALGQTYVKGQRDTMQSEVDDQTALSTRTSGPGAAKKFFGDLPKDISSDIQMKFSPAKFKSYGKKSPMKKLSDLSGDGKITKKDVLIGRGVINKDGSPAKYGNKKSPYKMKGYGSKRY